MDRQAFRDKQESRARRVRKGLPELMVRQVFKGLQAFRDLQESKVKQEIRGIPVSKVRQVYKGLPESREYPARLELKGKPDPKG
jgi:hypothetical protein